MRDLDTVSKQRRWQLKQRLFGNCTTCGKESRLNQWGKPSQYCLKHTSPKPKK